MPPLSIIDRYLTRDDSGAWNLVPPVSQKQLRHINCHKFALFVAGVISRDEMLSDPKTQKQENPKSDFTYGEKARGLSLLKFEPIIDVAHLMAFAREACSDDKIYVGQIRDAQTGEMAHSFVLQQATDGSFSCFDKAGFKHPFGRYKLEELFQYENYHNQEWRFVRIEHK